MLSLSDDGCMDASLGAVSRGDKAFCSVECRCRQIFMDEEETVRRENCSLAASPIRQVKGIARGGRSTAAATAASGGFVY